VAKPNNNRPDRGANKKAGNSPRLSPEEKKISVAKELGIRDNTKAFYDELIDNPKLGVRASYKKHIGDSTSELQASVNASRLKNSEKYEIYKASAVGKAKKRVVQLVGSTNESIALKASQDVLDRTTGKAIQKTENLSRVVEVKLDLTGVKIGAHYIAPDQLPEPTS
jgi:uncharacterized membrane-anchored protein YjiN (DUF445 family)